MADIPSGELRPQPIATSERRIVSLVILHGEEDVEEFPKRCNGQDIVLQILNRNVLLFVSNQAGAHAAALLSSLVLPRYEFDLISLGASEVFTPKT